MATLVLSAAGQAAGGALLPGGLSLFGAGISGAALGGAIGSLAGAYADQALFGGGAHREGPRLTELQVMASSEGAAIPRIYGRARLGGQVIWATNFREHASTQSACGGKGGGSSSYTSYSYTVSFAIGLCEGEVTRIGRIWADGELLSLGDYSWRLNAGGETQAPDPLIEAVEGAGNAPAYRGLAYLVFEDFPITAFGNRIPQVNVEVFRSLNDVEGFVRAVNVIPGAGEYVYDTVGQRNYVGEAASNPVNTHVSEGGTDFTAAMTQLQDFCPKVEAAALVVSWFGDDLRCGECSIAPRVEPGTKYVEPDQWSVAGLTRGDARVVSLTDGLPAYGGTPSDASVKRAVADMKARGLAVTFYPFVMMDVPAGNALPDPWTGAGAQPAYPWRGRMTCHPAPGVAGTVDGSADAETQVAAFFGTGGGWDYRRLVLHYAHLCAEAGGVEAFLIGSELRGLTKVRGAGGTYPAVTALKALAAELRGILGPDTKISYAADWSEYRGHSPGDAPGDFIFHLDPLWSDANIDFIGIDNYAPLTDWRDGTGHLDAQEGWGSIYDPAYLRARIAGGEDYDWYYASDADRAAQIRTSITDGAYGKPWIWRAKDLRGWWTNAHHDRPGGVESAAATGWVPQSKPVWFTELGCPAIDKGTNQPNLFVDPKSAESAVPHYSSGMRDDFIQRRFIEAEAGYWDPAHEAFEAANNPVSAVYGGRMVEPSRMFLWAWDARPFPAFPARDDIWGDAPNWACGHWLNGRMGAAPLNALVSAILSEMDFEEGETGALTGVVEGYVLDRIMTARGALEPLMAAKFFGAAETGGAIRFHHFGVAPLLALSTEDLAVTDESGRPGVTRVRGQESELPQSAKLTFIDGGGDYAQGLAEARRAEMTSRAVASQSFPMVLTNAQAQSIAETWLRQKWVERERATLTLPPSLLALEPGDTVRLEGTDYRLGSISDEGVRRAEAVMSEASLYGAVAAADRVRIMPGAADKPPVLAVFMDLPLITGEETPWAPHVAMAADPWPGSVALWQEGPGGIALDGTISAQATIGATLDDLAPGAALAGRWDEANSVTVRLASGALASAEKRAVLNGANRAAVGNEAQGWEVIQFREAELVAADTYRLSGLLRGLRGTERDSVLAAGARFVLLDGAVAEAGLAESERGLERRWFWGPASLPYDDESYRSGAHAFEGVGLRPLSPVHVSAERAADGTVGFTWIRRTRINGDSWLGLDVPLGEEAELYELDVLSGEGGDAVRTLSATSPEAGYTAEMQAADFGGAAPSPLHIEIYQLSPSWGPRARKERDTLCLTRPISIFLTSNRRRRRNM